MLSPEETSISAEARSGVTILDDSSNECHLEVARLLVRVQAEINRVDNVGWTPLHIAPLGVQSDSLCNLTPDAAFIDVWRFRYGSHEQHDSMLCPI